MMQTRLINSVTLGREDRGIGQASGRIPYREPRGCSTRTVEAKPPELARCSARKIESPVLCESSMITPLEYSASCSAAQSVCTGAAPPSPMPFAPLYENGEGDPCGRRAGRGYWRRGLGGRRWKGKQA